MVGLLDYLGYGGNAPRLDQLDPSQFGPEIGLLDPISLARMRGMGGGQPGSEGNPLAQLPPVPPTNLPFSQSPYTDPSAPPMASYPALPAEPTPAGPARGMVRAPSPPNVPGPGRTSATGGPSISRPSWLPRTEDVLTGMGQVPPEIRLLQQQGLWPGGGEPDVPGTGRVSPEFALPPQYSPLDSSLTPKQVKAVPGQQVGPVIGNTGGPPGGGPAPPLPPVPDPTSPRPTTPPPPSPPTAASMSANPWDRFGDFLAKNSNLFLGLSQMAAGRSIGEGIALAGQGISAGAQRDRANQAIALTKQTLMAKGYSEEEADAIANNPSMAKNVFENLYPQAPKPQYAVISEDPLTGAKTHGWVVPPQYIRPKLGTAQQTPNGPRYYRNGAQGEGWYTEPK